MSLLWNVKNQNFLITSFDQYSPNKLFILDIKLLSFDFSVDVEISIMTYFLMKNYHAAQKWKYHDLQRLVTYSKTKLLEKLQR